MRLPRVLYDAIKAHALEDAPREACGLVAFRASGLPVRVYRASNVALKPCEAYEVDPDDQLYIMRQMAAMGFTLGAVYHSHPTSDAKPSLRDMVAPYPGALMLIVGMGQGLTMTLWEIEKFEQGHTARQAHLEVV